ncbi:hypothetical protein EWM64_g5798 [Hericium alpestre]|uniref:Nucleoside transporter n=1 Tax=Hericium alpestre TaxID=135208 RepID=A0A4Y9ZUD9_9AGAM|nr:hypothetical protein EWM64_g5798 [Hericium alpestre]
MHERHRPATDTSIDAHYKTIPQAPEDDEGVIPSAAIEEPLDIEDADEASLAGIQHAHPPPVPSRIRWIHFLLGCAVLLPWNVMITATPYFISRLEGSPLRSTFSSWLSTSFTFANFFVLAYATTTAKKASSAKRVWWSTLCLAFLTFLLTLSTYVHLPTGVFFAFVLLNGIAQATAGSFLQTSVVAIASLFGPGVMQAVMSGQAAVAIVVSSVQVVSAATSLHASGELGIANDGLAEEKSAWAFFGLSTIFLVVCAGANVLLTRTPEYQAIVAPLDQSWTRRLSGEFNEPLVSQEVPATLADTKSQILRIARKNALYEFAVAYVFVVTLSVFPPLTISVQPTNPTIHPLLFSSVHFLVFNIGDFTGRYLCSIPRLLIWSAKRLAMLSAARTLFIPLFLACNITRDPSLPSTPPLINSDLLFMLTMLLFGLGNGYVSSLCMMAAGSLEHNPRLKGWKEDVDIAATVASFFLVGGLVTGSMMSFAVRAAVCGCNPFRT